MTATSAPRYDGLADWYDEYNLEAAQAHALDLVRLLGPGDGLCLDLGCGTGHYLDALARTGRSVVGMDFSADQLRVAQTRTSRLVRGDAGRLPFGNGVFRTVAALWISTDVDDFAVVLAECARVLEPGGTLLFSGVHPCFNGPHVELREDGTRVVHPVYRDARWHLEAPWWGYSIRRRTGMRHIPLAELLNGFARAGLSIAEVEEPAGTDIPWALTIRATRR